MSQPVDGAGPSTGQCSASQVTGVGALFADVSSGAVPKLRSRRRRDVYDSPPIPAPFWHARTRTLQAFTHMTTDEHGLRSLFAVRVERRSTPMDSTARSAAVVATLIVIAIGAAACHHAPPVLAPSRTPVAKSVAPAPPAPPPVTAVPPPSRPPLLTEDEVFARKDLAALNTEKPLKDAFFDFDRDQIRADAATALERDAEWLRRWPSTKVVVQGYADDRGSDEYNLALGERRATAVVSYLHDLGIPSDRLSVTSFGDERSFCSEDTETCWQRNRRGHFVITAK